MMSPLVSAFVSAGPATKILQTFFLYSCSLARRVKPPSQHAADPWWAVIHHDQFTFADSVSRPPVNMQVFFA
jgi:hypothetical protein